MKLVLGPANAAKAAEVLGAYPAAARRGGLLVVPNAADADHYTRELAGEGALLGSVLTFPALMRVIAQRAGYEAQPLSALQREHVLAGVLQRTSLPAGAGLTPGLVAAASALIDELQRALVTPQRFAGALARWSAEDPRRRERARELGLLYRLYLEELERIGRPDEVLYAWRALDALRASPSSWRGSPVYLYGFDDLLGIERDAIETLAQIAAAEVVVSLTYEPGRTALQARAGAVAQLRAIADDVVQLPARADHYAEGSRAALHLLERGLFEPVAGAPGDAGVAVALLEAGGERSEAELIAARVVELCGQGLAAEEIAIICRAPGRAAALLRSILERHGIAVAAELEHPLFHSALAGALLALVRCADPATDASADDLLRYLRVRASARGQRLERLDALELEVRRRGLRSAEQVAEALDRRPPEVERLRSARRPGAELLRIGCELLAAAHAGGVPLDREAELDARALARLAGALDELEALGECPPLQALPALLGSLTFRDANSPRPGAVLLCDPLQIRARRPRAVIVCGLVEGEWPAAGRCDPLLSDEQRFELARCSGLRLEPREERLAAERYLFYSVLTRATERVVLSWRCSDEEGNAVAPSPFLADVLALFGDGLWERRQRRLLADVVWPADGAPSARERARARAAQAGRAAGVAGEPPICLSPAALACLRHRQIVSGGALEAFAACPVRWLIERQLQPRALGPDPEPLRRGSYMHRVLERVFTELGAPLCEQTLPRALEILERVLARPWTDDSAAAPGEPPIGVGHTERVRAAMRLSIAADLRRYLRCEARSSPSWAPSALELRFGFGEEGLPPLVLRGRDGREVALRGVIDRIDVEPGGRRAIVRDYKAGASRPEQQGARWLIDYSLQVGLYMLAAARLLDLEPVAGLYQPLGGRDLRARGVHRADLDAADGLVATDRREREQLQRLLEELECEAVAIWARLCTGVLERLPQRCSRAGCRYPGICRGG